MLLRDVEITNAQRPAVVQALRHFADSLSAESKRAWRTGKNFPATQAENASLPLHGAAVLRPLLTPHQRRQLNRNAAFYRQRLARRYSESS